MQFDPEHAVRVTAWLCGWPGAVIITSLFIMGGLGLYVRRNNGLSITSQYALILAGALALLTGCEPYLVNIWGMDFWLSLTLCTPIAISLLALIRIAESNKGET
jgi:hypothetical protein